MRNPEGYALRVDPERPDEEWDTFTCGHCQRVTFVTPFIDAASMGGLCKVCGKLICERCTALDACQPWERRFEAMEARERFLRAAGIFEGG